MKFLKLRVDTEGGMNSVRNRNKRRSSIKSSISGVISIKATKKISSKCRQVNLISNQVITRVIQWKNMISTSIDDSRIMEIGCIFVP